VLPSFLLAFKSYSMGALFPLVLSFLTDADNWKKSSDIPVDFSTAYRWLRAIHEQAVRALPVIRKELLNFTPAFRIKETKLEAPDDEKKRIKRFITLSGHLFKAIVRLSGTKSGSEHDLFCFLNFFLARTTGKPLLVL
jgi:hypothetical protein